MPLSSPAPRQSVHTRTIACNGYQRDDGLWEVEGHLRDTRGFDFHTPWRGTVPKGQPVHDMWMRITFGEDMVIRGVEVVTDVGPYPESCPHALDHYQKLVGEHIGSGFARRARQQVGGVLGCTHQTEMLRVLGSAAMQTMTGHFTHIVKDFASSTEMFGSRGAQPAIINSCHSYATDNEIVAQLYPDYYTGPRRED